MGVCVYVWDKKLFPFSFHLPPSSVITVTVEAGPWPSGLNTCSETRYCVKVSKLWILWFWNTRGTWRELSAYLSLPPTPLFLVYTRFFFLNNSARCKVNCYATYFDGGIANINVLHFFVRLLASSVSYAVSKELAVYGVAARRLPRQVNRRRWGIMGRRDGRFSFRYCTNKSRIFRTLFPNLSFS